MYEHVFQCSVKLLRVCFFVGVVQLCCVLSQVLLLVTIDAQVTLLPEVFNLLLSNLTNEIDSEAKKLCFTTSPNPRLKASSGIASQTLVLNLSGLVG